MNKIQLMKRIDVLNAKMEKLVDKEHNLQKKIDDLDNKYEKLKYDRVSDIFQLERNILSNKSSKLQDIQYDLACEICSLESELTKLEQEYSLA